MEKTFYVYILAGQSGVIYTGVTSDLMRRVAEHKQRKIPGFTQRYNVTLRASRKGCKRYRAREGDQELDSGEEGGVDRKGESSMAGFEPRRNGGKEGFLAALGMTGLLGARRRSARIDAALPRSGHFSVLGAKKVALIEKANPRWLD